MKRNFFGIAILAAAVSVSTLSAEGQQVASSWTNPAQAAAYLASLPAQSVNFGDYRAAYWEYDSSLRIENAGPGVARVVFSEHYVGSDPTYRNWTDQPETFVVHYGVNGGLHLNRSLGGFLLLWPCGTDECGYLYSGKLAAGTPLRIRKSS